MLAVRCAILASIVAVSVNSGAQCSQRTQGAQPVLSLSLTAAEKTVKAGSPLWVNVTAINKSNHDVSLWRDAKGGFEVEVRNQKGGLAHETKFGRFRNGHVDLRRIAPEDVHELSSSGACVSLKAGQKLPDKINVSLMYEPLQPGKYTIQVSAQDPESTKVVKSNPMIVTVIP